VYVDQLLAIEDVTERIRAAVTAQDEVTQLEQRQAVIAEIQSACETSDDLRCQVVRFYQGGMYSLYTYKRFTDVRLVMAPEGQAAFFGGDPDNFTYPRYDLDLTLYRVYENGEPRQTDHYFKFSENGAAEDELVFVTGNPGSTGRLLTMAQMEYLRDVDYPARLARYERSLSVLRKLAARSEADQRRYQNQIFGYENSHKAVTGYLTGLVDEERMAAKAAFEKDFRSRIAADPALQEQFGGAWNAIAKAQKQIASFAVERRWHGFGGSQLMNLAGGIVRLPQQSALPEEQRLLQYRAGELDTLRAEILSDAEFDLEAEMMNLAAQLKAAQTELPADDPYLSAMLGGKDPWVAAEAMIEGTRLTDLTVRQALLDGGMDAVAASDDPLIVAARAVAPLSLEAREAGRTARSCDRGERRVGRTGDLRRLREGTATRRHLHAPHQRRRREALPNERHLRTVQDDVVRPLCPRRRVRLPGPLDARSALAGADGPGEHVDADQFRLDERHHRRQLR
jgi:hypothetical protein